MSAVDNIIKIANSYIGQQEVQPNQSFKDPSFLKKMVAIGWLKGQAWCSYFAKLVWSEAYADNPAILAKVKHNGTGGAMNTLDNYKAAGFVVNLTPVPGAIVIFREGDTWNGHAGIVTSVPGDGTFHSVEGNTNTDGSRDGYEVAAKVHTINKPHNPTGLNVAGFIHPQ